MKWNSLEEVDWKSSAWGRKPRKDIKPPLDRQWTEDWKRAVVSAGNHQWEPIWSRNALELDGHEECCRHVWPIWRKVK